MLITKINNQEDYHKAVKRMDKLTFSDDKDDEDELRFLVTLIEKYDKSKLSSSIKKDELEIKEETKNEEYNPFKEEAIELDDDEDMENKEINQTEEWFISKVDSIIYRDELEDCECVNCKNKEIFVISKDYALHLFDEAQVKGILYFNTLEETN